MSNVIKRKIYKKINEVINNRQIPIIIGLRRIGKTTLLKQLSKEHNAKIIAWDSYEMVSLSPLDFFSYIKNQAEIASKGSKLLLFDEVQVRNDWYLMIKNLFDRFTADNMCNFVVTGSSSMILMGKEMGVNRTKRMYLDTWDFDEYLSLTKKEKNFENFETFLGLGFPDYAINPPPHSTSLFETLLPILKNDIPKAFPGVDPLILVMLINHLANLTNGEVNYSKIAAKISVNYKTVVKYIDILEQAMLLKKIYKINSSGNFPKKKIFKIYINPHIHLWILKKKFADLNNKIKGHIIESYWLHWATSIDGFFREFYYLKDDNTKKEIDFVSLNPDGSFKTLHEFKYKNNINFSDYKTLFSIKSTNKVLWCKDTKKDDIKCISILDINKN